MELVNPLNAFRDSYSLLEGLAADKARRTAGDALTQGDYGGAQNALYGRGLLDEGNAVAQQQRQMNEQEKADAKERVQWLGQAATALRKLPAEQRRNAFDQHVKPVIAMMPGMDDPQVLAQIEASDFSDQTLDAFMAALGQEAQKYQLFQSDSLGVVAVDPNNPADFRTIVEPKADPLDDEYRRAQIDYLRAGVGSRDASADAARARAAKTRSGASKGGGATMPWERRW